MPILSTSSLRLPSHESALLSALTRGLALLVLVAVSGCGTESQDTGKQDTPPDRNQNSKISLDRSRHDFGKILHGRSPSTTFKLHNIGKDRLRILGEQNSCSCAEIKHQILDKDGKEVDRPIYLPPLREKDGTTLVTWIEPGETLKLTVRIVTSKRDPVAKQESSETHLLFEDPAIGEVVLGYRFFIDPPILVDPAPGFRAMSISKGATGVEGFELYPGIGKKPFRITKIEGADELAKLEKAQAHRPNGHRYMLKMGPFPAKDLNWVRNFWFHTDLEGGYKMHVMVGGEIVQDLEFFGPKGQDFGRFDFANPVEKKMDLRYNGKRDKPRFEIRKLEILDSKQQDVSNFFEASVVHRGGKRWYVLLKYKGGLQSRRFSGNYQLHTNVEGFEKTEIGVTGFRLDKP